MDKSKIEKFLGDEDENIFSFQLKKLEKDKVILSIEDEFEFTIESLKNGYKISSKEEVLKEFVKNVQDYCDKKGKKSIVDILENATEAYSNLDDGDEDDDEDGGDTPVTPTNGFDFPDIQVVKSGNKNTEYKKMKYIEDRFIKKSKRNVSKGAASRLMRDYLQLVETDTSKLGFTALPIGDDLFNWHVKMYHFQGALAKDMKSLKIDHILFEMTFPDNYPLSPPFIRVLKPRFQHLTGHITIGGSICMQLLTPSGWSPANSIESIFVQIRFEIEHGKPRLNFSNTSPYTIYEAKDAFNRVSKRYGWDK